MAQIAISYEGELTTLSVHEGNGSQLQTDAPKAVGGKECLFSPTDLVGVSLGSCALTLMGMAAHKQGFDLKGLRVVVSKEMQSAPVRRIQKIRLEFFCPQEFSEAQKRALIEAAEHCPVHHSLHPEVHQEFIYQWGIA